MWQIKCCGMKSLFSLFFTIFHLIALSLSVALALTFSACVCAVTLARISHTRHGSRRRTAVMKNEELHSVPLQFHHFVPTHTLSSPSFNFELEGKLLPILIAAASKRSKKSGERRRERDENLSRLSTCVPEH